MSWDADYDILVVGSGAAGLAAAATAAADGLSTLVIEKTKYWGGTTSYSGGGVWIPANPLMVADGADDSIETGLEYLNNIVEDAGPASSPQRKLAFLTNGPEMVCFLADEGLRWRRTARYPDYYPDRPGGRIGRQLEPAIFDGKLIGPMLASLRRPPGASSLVIHIDDFDRLVLAFRTRAGFARGARVVARTAAWKLLRKAPLALGPSLLAQLMAIALRHRTDVWLSSPLRELVIEDGRVVGAVVVHAGKPVRIRTRGVVLGAGGFARNTELRRRYQPVNGDWSSTIRGDTGEVMQAAIDVGADTALMDDAWWGASFLTPDGAAAFCLWERSLPGGVIVDRNGMRFANESMSYVDLGHAQLGTNSIPAWLIMDARHRNRYPFLNMLPRRTPKSGLLLKADSLQELAAEAGIDANGLLSTVERFNRFAATGKDEDFDRGSTIYDNYYGDPRVKPNPNLGPIERAPFWAARLYPGDLGTKGGVLTDENARALQKDGTPIEGLYAAGNTSATVMGRTYPGPGGTLGPAMVFGYLAAKHLTKTIRS